MNIDDLLRDKETTHGHFDETATVAQTLKAVMRRGRNWESLPNQSKEALELIATKVARILNGDASDPEHWFDICGYAKLRANAFAPSYQKPKTDALGNNYADLETGISSIAKRLRPVAPTRVNDEGGVA